MAPMPFSEKFVQEFPDVYEYAEQGFISTIIAYVIDSSFRQAYNLSKWIRAQVSAPTAAVIAAADQIAPDKDPEVQAFLVMRWVQDHITYEGDSLQWKASEYWARADETIASLEGDCEDGAILMYVLCRLKGVPANRLFLWAGQVQNSPTAPSGGHCCLFMKPNNFPLNFVNLDWCYYPSQAKVSERPIIDLQDNSVTEYAYNSDGWALQWSRYQQTWFAFNEEIGYSTVKPNDYS